MSEEAKEGGEARKKASRDGGVIEKKLSGAIELGELRDWRKHQMAKEAIKTKENNMKIINQDQNNLDHVENDSNNGEKVE